MAQLAQFSGRGEGRVAVPTDLPTRRSLSALQARLADTQARRATLLEQGNRLIRAFAEKYPDSPARVVRYADRTLNDYRWRLSRKAKWRHLGIPSNAVTLELTGELGRHVLASLPEVARMDWLSFEARRQALNYQSAVTKYEVMRLRQLIVQQEQLRQLGRQGGR